MMRYALLPLLLLSGCASLPPPQEGIRFIGAEHTEATLCYHYSLEQGRQFARNEVRKMALKEAIAAYQVTIRSNFVSRTHCLDSQCEQQIENYLQQVSEHAIQRMETHYFEPSHRQMCIVATINFAESMDSAARALGFDEPAPSPTSPPPRESIRSCELLGACHD
ncbi:hypothetical protein D5085_15775 [Ectothiorhodospiraceae bacterium BW-2]|nr:hypothetical protein D5085_15775 [Ectothiorhodospiraceae bacterium BW-2]